MAPLVLFAQQDTKLTSKQRALRSAQSWHFLREGVHSSLQNAIFVARPTRRRRKTSLQHRPYDSRYLPLNPVVFSAPSAIDYTEPATLSASQSVVFSSATHSATNLSATASAIFPQPTADARPHYTLFLVSIGALACAIFCVLVVILVLLRKCIRRRQSMSHVQESPLFGGSERFSDAPCWEQPSQQTVYASSNVTPGANYPSGGSLIKDQVKYLNRVGLFCADETPYAQERHHCSKLTHDGCAEITVSSPAQHPTTRWAYATGGEQRAWIESLHYPVSSRPPTPAVSVSIAHSDTSADQIGRGRNLDVI